MTNEQVIIHSPTAESSAEMSAQINDTVKMTSYQVKRKLQAEMQQEADLYNNLKNHIREDIDPYIQETIERVQNSLKEIITPKIATKLSSFSDWFEIGEEGTYFDDNRTEEVSFTQIAEAMLEISAIHIVNTHAEIKYYINLYASTEATPYHGLDVCTLIFTPTEQIKLIDLTDEEIGHQNNLLTRTKEMEEANKRYNALELQLKNLDNLSEDIEYALLKEKHSHTTTVDLVDRLTDSLLNSSNISPDFLLNKD